MNSTTPLERRHFLRSTTAAALGVLGPTGSCLSAAQPVQKASPAESLVKVLHESLNEKQRKAMCFAWDHVDPKRGLLRNASSSE